jgi:MHS family proline/betaine transporter-like MFS transporter
MRRIFLPILAVSAVFVEWIEFSVYLYLSTKISSLFFPKDDPQAAFLMTMLIFTASYLIRPIGARL